MLTIDRLIHAVHQDEPGGKAVTSPAAQNVIHAGRGSIKRMLDELAYGDQAGMERVEVHEKYLKLMKDEDGTDIPMYTTAAVDNRL